MVSAENADDLTVLIAKGHSAPHPFECADDVEVVGVGGRELHGLPENAVLHRHRTSRSLISKGLRRGAHGIELVRSRSPEKVAVPWDRYCRRRNP